jgi:uncharacterized protein
MLRFSGRRTPSYLLGGAALALAGWLGSSAMAAWSLTARPSPQREEALPRWLRAESVRLETRDGEEIGAWFHPGAPGRAIVIFLHGLGGSRASLALSAQRVAMEGNGFLALSLRSFGDSSGGALDFGWGSRADLVAAVEFAEAQKPDAPLVVVGQSLGAAAAIFAAPELGRRVDGYVLEAPYLDLEKACRDRLERELIAPFDELAYAGLELWAPLFLPIEISEVNPAEHVAQFPEGVPVLFVAGAFDTEAPVEDVRKLTELCSGAAELAVLDQRDHFDLWTMDERHFELWQGFLARIEDGETVPNQH